MKTSQSIKVGELSLDLQNFRTIKQPDELHAVNAIINTNPDWYLELAKSILNEGYLPTENIIVLKKGKKLIVKEGNRRISILKIIFGHIEYELTPEIDEKITQLSDEWKNQNEAVSCIIYPETDAAKVDNIISLTHARGQKAGRDQWKAIAKARYDKAIKKISQPGLTLFEKFLNSTKRLTPNQVETWAGNYPITILDEALPKIAAKLGTTPMDIATSYPTKGTKKAIDDILDGIGSDAIGFKDVRLPKDGFVNKYIVGKIKGVAAQQPSPGNPSSSAAGETQNQQPPMPSSAPSPTSSTVSQHNSTGTAQSANQSPASSNQPANTSKTPSRAINDPKSVQEKLKAFKPMGNGRSKLVSILNEIRELSPDKFPHAFCFLLRSLFEISAKAYCDDLQSTGITIKTKESNGFDRDLVKILNDITEHLTNNGHDTAMKRLLHGAITELTKSGGILSVTSMNQLVHSQTFSVIPSDVCIMFNNVFPLLQEMNK